MNRFYMPLILDDDAGKAPNATPIIEYIKLWGSGFLAFAAACAAVYFAVMIIIDSFKAARAEDAESKKALIKGIIWKVVWFLVAISGAAIFGVLTAVVNSNMN